MTKGCRQPTQAPKTTAEQRVESQMHSVSPKPKATDDANCL